MSDARGRRLVWRLLERAGIYHPTFTGTRHGDFNEGMRNGGLQLIGDLRDHCPELFVQMQAENFTTFQPKTRDDATDNESTGE